MKIIFLGVDVVIHERRMNPSKRTMEQDEMYEVNGTKFTGYITAIEAAKKIGAEVFEVREDGSKIRRWTPAAAVTAKRMRQHAEHKAAYTAQEAQKAK